MTELNAKARKAAKPKPTDTVASSGNLSAPQFDFQSSTLVAADDPDDISRYVSI
ncbi:hypothetical protein Hanom_Chr09g00822861 [Helianthus anomalus]